MEKITAGHPLSQSEDIVKQNIDTLKALFPTIVKEGKIDIGELKGLLGEDVEENEEYYRFTWAGKSQARQEANKPSTGTLRPHKAESKDWDTTQNIFIEGDNLEVLKLLQKSYAGQIKMIYIDPPYNTGRDFVYKDNYADNLENYLEITGQTDDEGKRFGTNSESDGRYHSNWLNMLYPRLKLARNLLADEGVIFISIGDQEVQNLRKVCDEIFGEENFEGHIHWRRRHNQPNDKTKMIGLVAEHITAYSKNKEAFKKSGVGKVDLTGDFSNPDNDPRGDWASKPWKVGSDQSGSRYVITNLTNGKQYDEEWMGEEKTYKALLEDKRIVFPRSGDGFPRKKYFRFEREEEGQCATNWWSHQEFGHNQGANDEMTSLFGGKNIFSNPKPKELIRGLLQISNAKNDSIILDFFAGSGTTAHAVMELNLEDNGNRKYICVQLPEIIDEKDEAFSAGYLTIAEITKERIRRAGEKLKSQASEDNLFSQKSKKLDIGFKVFKLDTSNINAWDGSVENFEQNLFNSANNIKEGRKEEDVLYEILLKSGLDLSQQIDEKEIGGKKVYSVGLGALFICLANNINTAVAEGIGKWKAELNPATCTVIFKDAGLTDVEKANSIQILKRYGITEVNSI